MWNQTLDLGLGFLSACRWALLCTCLFSVGEFPHVMTKASD